MKFKVGDKVKLIKEFPSQYDIGDTGTLKMHGKLKKLYLPYKDNPDSEEGNIIEYYLDCFELVESYKPADEKIAEKGWGFE